MSKLILLKFKTRHDVGIIYLYPLSIFMKYKTGISGLITLPADTFVRIQTSTREKNNIKQSTTLFIKPPTECNSGVRPIYRR